MAVNHAYVSFAGHTFGALVVCFSIFLNCTMNLKIEIRFVCGLKFNYNCTTITVAPFRIMMYPDTILGPSNHILTIF